jgi:hypothetical protein
MRSIRLIESARHVLLFLAIVGVAACGDDPITGPVEAPGSTEAPVLNTVPTGTSSIGDLVWEDRDQDGIQDTGEPGIAGVTVELLSVGKVVASTTTDASGNYQFASIAAGTYQVKFVLGADQRFTHSDQGTDDAVDSDADGTTGISHSVTLAVGEANTTVDAGIVTQASLSGRVWDDVNRNGIQDAGEPGVAGIDVMFGRVSSHPGTRTQTTDANGDYTFTNIWPTAARPHGGPHYQLRVVPPAGQSFARKDQGGDDTKDSDVREFDITAYPDPSVGTIMGIGFNAGEQKNHVDAGLIGILVTIGDRVWNDLDEDGIQDAGEPGLASVDVYLWCPHNPHSSCRSTQTDANGDYLFTDLNPTRPPAPGGGGGMWRVRFALEPDFSFSLEDQGTDDEVDSDADPNDHGFTHYFWVAPGASDLTIDAGMYSALNSIGDRVWEDLNLNDTQERHPGCR